MVGIHKKETLIEKYGEEKGLLEYKRLERERKKRSKRKSIILDQNNLEQEIKNGNAIKCEECGFIGPRIQWSHLKYKCSGNTLTIQDYKKKHPSALLVAPNASKELGATKQRIIQLYGETEGLQRWDEYKSKQAKSNTFEYKAKKHGWSEKDFEEFNKSRAVTLENLVKKYGEEDGHNKWDDYCERQKYTCSLEYFQDQYGDVEGEQKYNNFHKQRIKRGGAISKQEQFVYSTLQEHISDLKPQLDFDGQNQTYVYDMGSVKNKKIIEFNGDYWHMNPKLYESTDIHDRTGKSAQIIWDNDNAKLAFIKSQGYDVYVIWELDWYKNKDKVIEDVVKWWNNEN